MTSPTELQAALDGQIAALRGKPGQATWKDIYAACQDRSAGEAMRFLNSIGLSVRESKCDVAIARMIARGERSRLPNPIGDTVANEPSVDPVDTEIGCQRLAEAMDAHYDAKVDRLGCSFEAAKLSCLYSPAQLARMA